jgi:hypothetical protein
MTGSKPCHDIKTWRSLVPPPSCLGLSTMVATMATVVFHGFMPLSSRTADCLFLILIKATTSPNPFGVVSQRVSPLRNCFNLINSYIPLAKSLHMTSRRNLSKLVPTIVIHFHQRWSSLPGTGLHTAKSTMSSDVDSSCKDEIQFFQHDLFMFLASRPALRQTR